MPDTLSRKELADLRRVHVGPFLPQTSESCTECANGACEVPALIAHIDALTAVLREAIEAVHQTGSIRDHADPNDKTGWNVHGIETCADPLCVDALALLDRP